MNIITAKDLVLELGVSLNTAKKYLSDMKQYYEPPSKKLTMSHLKDYFSIPSIKKDQK